MKDPLYRSQKKIFQFMKNRALEFETQSNKNLLAYRKNYEAFSRKKYKRSTLQQLNHRLIKSRFIFVADFHTFDQNVKNLIRLIQLLIKQKKHLCLTLEMADYHDSELISSYLDGHITELEFMESINFGKSWNFPWTHYKSIFDFVKKNKNIRIVGVNTAGNLPTRDQFCAKTLANLWKNDPQCVYITLYGECHLAPNRIPAHLFQLLPEHKNNTIILHQNLDTPYWKLGEQLKKNLRADSVVQYDANHFCLLTAPPWMKYESMCYWFENLFDDPDFDLHRYIIESGLKAHSATMDETFSYLCAQIIKLLKLPLNADELFFNLYHQDNLSYIDKFIKKFYPQRSLQVLLNQLIQTQYFLVLPDTQKIYCPNYSANKLIKLAGAFLYQLLGKKKENRFTNIVLAKDKTAYLALQTQQNFFSYFAAKCLNPYIKCPLFLDIKKINSDTTSKTLRNSTNTVLKVLKLSKDHHWLKSLTFAELTSAGKYLGEMLAEMYFHNIQHDHMTFKLEQMKKDFLSFEHSWVSLQQTIKLVLKANRNYRTMHKRYF